jgi:hypothetical protein
MQPAEVDIFEGFLDALLKLLRRARLRVGRRSERQ